MQKVEGSSPFSRFKVIPGEGVFASPGNTWLS
jgi:hypothetical protein